MFLRLTTCFYLFIILCLLEPSSVVEGPTFPADWCELSVDGTMLCHTFHTNPEETIWCNALLIHTIPSLCQHWFSSVFHLLRSVPWPTHTHTHYKTPLRWACGTFFESFLFFLFTLFFYFQALKQDNNHVAVKETIATALLFFTEVSLAVIHYQMWYSIPLLLLLESFERITSLDTHSFEIFALYLSQIRDQNRLKD